MPDHLDVRVHRRDRVGRGVDLRSADVVLPVHDLALQVGLVDHVEVQDADAADPGRGEVEQGRRPEAAGADAEHRGRLEPALARPSRARG